MPQRSLQSSEFDLKAYLSWLPMPVDDQLLAGMMLHFCEPVHRFVVPKGQICEALPQLRQRVKHLGIVSNSPVPGLCHLRALELLQIRPYFDFALFSYDLGIRKPDTAFFQKALDVSGCQPGQAMMVGDSLALDVLPARKLGLAGVHFDPLAVSENHQVIRHFGSLVTLLEQRHPSREFEA